MAFNFNWSPLTADASFYTRAQELLTNALNKAPKPPIIVDDIIVSELNLGTVPPDLEILEVGDLAEDRFRGIFKMRYSGNAFLTLKTRVQANPLNTYLSTRPSFASPEPLAAASGLTIPIKITLSDIKLSAFIILVFSKSKGLTLVFRNDPLESLKVSSTFDSIPFVRDFLQRTIEQQLRNLLMEDVPAIIHRLSLQLFVPEYRAQEEAKAVSENKGEHLDSEDGADPFASPPQDPVDYNGNPVGAAEITALSLDPTADAPIFSHRNLLRLAALTDSHRTLSPFTPTLKDVIFRAWAGSLERAEGADTSSPIHMMLSRRQSQVDFSSTPHSFSAASSDVGSGPIRPGLFKQSSTLSTRSVGASKSGKPRKKKHRIINLRKQKTAAGDLATIADETMLSETASTATSDSASAADSAPVSAPTLPTSYETSLGRNADDEVVTPPSSPPMRRKSNEKQDVGKTPRRVQDLHLQDVPHIEPLDDSQATIRRKPQRALFQIPDEQSQSKAEVHESIEAGPSIPQRPKPSRYFQSFQFPERPSSPFNVPALSRGASPDSTLPAPFPYGESAPGGVFEQAWMMKMAGEIARRMQEQKGVQAGSAWDRTTREDTPPPAYAA